MPNKAKKLEAECPWESGKLGTSEDHVVVVRDNDLDKKIDEALSLQPISIRIEKNVIDAFKTIAAREGMGYQPLMRQILKRFAVHELKRLHNEIVANSSDAENSEELEPLPDLAEPSRMIA